MKIPCSAPRTLVKNSQRLISTSKVRLKGKRSKKQQAELQPIEIPGVPSDPRTPISDKLQKRLEKAVPKHSSSSKRKTRSSNAGAVEGINRIVTGWGEDKLAPSTSGSSHSASRKDHSLVNEFEYEAFYRHGPNMPHFDRRVHTYMAFPNTLKTLETIEPEEPQPPVPRLAHSLERVLFNSGPHWLRDPRSRVYNFDSSLEKIPDIHDFDFKRLIPYVTSSRDETLTRLAKREGKAFAGSTSSLSSLLSHIYFLLANGRQTDTSTLSSAFTNESRAFTYGARWPGGIALRYQDGVYCIDSDGVEEPEKHLLLNMGTMLEKFITHSPSEFSYLRRNSPMNDVVEAMKRPESYRYSKSDAFVMRSQLDAQDSRLPGSGVFDIKTRAAVAIRYDPLNYQHNTGYLIRTQHGLFESFEREHYDLIRSAFLKYLFQARIGNMDGIFVAYHNTALMFGFEYFSREYMDERLFGGAVQGDRVFDRCVKCMERIASEITLCFPGESVKCSFETSEQDGALRIYVEPEEWHGKSEDDRPIAELLVTATSYLNGVRAEGPMDFGTHEDDWGTLLSVTRSRSTMPGMGKSIRINKDALVERKNAFGFWLPQGVTAAEMAERWVKIDYTGKAINDSQDGTEGLIGQTSAATAEELAQLALKFKHRQHPSSFVSALREMAKNGREHLTRLDSADLVGESDTAAPIIPEGSSAAEGSSSNSDSSQESESVWGGDRPDHSFSKGSGDIEPVQDFLPSPSVEAPREDDGSMQVKVMGVDMPSHVAKEEIQTSTDAGFSEIPANGDNALLPPSEVDATVEDLDHSEPLDVELSEDQVIEVLDPINQDGSHSSEAVPEGDGGVESKVEWTDEDQAWGGPKPEETDERGGVQEPNPPSAEKA